MPKITKEELDRMSGICEIARDLIVLDGGMTDRDKVIIGAGVDWPRCIERIRELEEESSKLIEDLYHSIRIGLEGGKQRSLGMLGRRSFRRYGERRFIELVGIGDILRNGQDTGGE